MNLQQQLETRYQLYKHNGVLLDNSELIHYNSIVDTDSLGGELLAFIRESEKVVGEDLQLQMQTLEEAEQNRDQALAAKDEAEKLRKEAEDREEKLKILYKKLSEKNKLSEQQLSEERKARHAENTINFQRVLIYVLGGLIAMGILLSHISGNLSSVNEKLIDLTKDAIILLLQIFGMAASYVFGSQQKQRGDQKVN